ncbi:MAG: IPT/TIG domain-containing protein, partial [Myxococcales bacterium]|nr:IPT/TIG domain-containing protein [Myxococcales bacterium]
MRKAMFQRRLVTLFSVLLFGMFLFSGQMACNCGDTPGLEGSEQTDGGGEKVVDSVCPKPGDTCQDNSTCQACGSLLTCIQGVCVDTGEPFDLDSIPFCPSIGSTCTENSDCQKPNCNPLECSAGVCKDVVPDDKPDGERCPLTCSNSGDCAVKACGERVACLNGVCGPPQQLCPDKCDSDEQCRTPDCGERVRCVANKCGTIQQCPNSCNSDAQCQQANCGTRIACKGGVCSEPDANTPPVAVIDPIRDAPQVGNRITMDGRNSTDADGDKLTFRWRITKRPQGSQSSFDDNTSATPAFIPDFAGVYSIELIVNDGKVDSKATVVDLNIKNSALPPPVLNAIAPKEVSEDQLPVEVALFGANFLPDSKITLNGAGQTVNFINVAELRFKASGIAVGTYKIQVENADGQKSAALDFVVKPKQANAPRIDSLSPSQLETGTPIQFKVVGDFFVAGATATLGGNPVSVTFNNAQVLEIITAAALMIGSYDVIITNPDGQKSNAVKFTITPRAPVLKLDSITPSEIVAGVKTTLKLVGDAFVPGATVVINGQSFAPTSVAQQSIAVDVTLATAGTYTVVVRNPDGSITNSLPLVVKNGPPKLSFVDPTSIQEFTAFTLRLSGSGFLNGAQGRLDGTAYPTTFVSATELRVTLPNTVKAGTYAVDVLNPDNQKSNTVTLTVTPKPPAPKLATIVPARIEQGSGTEISVHGSLFVTGAQIQIGPRLLNATFDSATKLRVKVPTDLVAGNYPVVVFNPDGQKSNTGT